jgi:ankyrin repeat protein
LKQSITAAEQAKRLPTAEEQIAARHSDWRATIASWLVKVVGANVDEEAALKRFAVQKSHREHRERESARVAAEERALAAAEQQRAQAERPPSHSQLIRAPGPTQEFFILEVLAKVFVRNLLRDAVRRVSLQEYLRRKEHELLLVYGSSEYKRKDRERLLREKAEREARQRYLLRVQAARQMSGGIVANSLDQAKVNAEVLMFDPWTLLDLHPGTWLSPAVLHVVEDSFHRAKGAYQLQHMRLLFHYLRREWGVARLKTRRNRRTCKLCLRSIWRDMMGARHISQCARTVQNVVRRFVLRQRLWRHLLRLQTAHQRALQHEAQRLQQQRGVLFRFWRKECSLAYRYKATIFALKDRRFILTFYIWRDQFKKHRLARIKLNSKQVRACISLQAAVRCFVARRKFLKRWALKRMVGLARRYLARRRVQSAREYERRLGDYRLSTALTHNDKQLRRHLQAWRRARNVIVGVSHLDVAVHHDKLRRRFTKWVKLAQHRTQRLAKRAIKIQAQMRRYLVQKFVLHYYRWRRGLVLCQAVYRGRLAVRQFTYDIYFYRMARRIQRVFRGYRCRIHLNDQRVLDIHYAAANNNYDRLNYYVHKFPELIPLPDAEGNNALHNAAKNACKRTLKLLMRHGALNPNIKNPQGYTALHLTIISVSPQRDDCYLYMMERGFSDEVHGPDGKTTLLIAAEYGRTIITRHLLAEEDHNPNIADANGTTALQAACWQGNVAMVRDLIDNEADVNMPGYNGTFPLHDCVYGGSAEIAQLLLAHGAYVNVYEPYLYQTPLMYACAAGKADIARLYLIAGAEVNARDSKGQTAAHLGVPSNSADVYNALREADADFDGQDCEGNSPLHVAAEVGASEFAIAMLHGGTYPSWQNNKGDQPAHIAARYNQLELLKQICRYDEHIGRVNYDHQTPLGVAKFHLAKECQQFLTHHYRMVEVKDGRNRLGEIWWDKDIDDAVGHWEVSVNAAGERFYMNRKTAQVSMQPPAISASAVAKTAQRAELPLHRTVTVVKEENTITKHAYYLDYASKERDVAEIAKDYVNATIIVKFARRKLARLELRRLKAHKKRTAALTRFIKRHLPGFMLWRYAVYGRCATKIQAAYRGHKLRKRYFAYPKGEYFRRRLHKAHWRLRYKLWARWKFYIRRQEFKLMRLNKNQPQTLHDWQVIIDQARRPVRKVGIYEDYLYPGTHNIHFYRHSLTGACTFNKPKKMRLIDETATIERQQVKKYGATVKQLLLATKLQALWRGYAVRTYSKYVARAMQISLHAEANYLSNPDLDANLYNYALYCFVDLQDLTRARRAFVEALRRMQWRGPDIPFVLYSYSIFALVARDEDYHDVMLLLTRARQAELELDAIKRTKLGGSETALVKTAEGDFRYGKSYDLANTGFFRHMAVQSHNSFGWQAYAVCRFLVYRDFNSSFDAFMDAFRFAPDDKHLMECFNIMMTHFHGKNKAHRDEVYKNRQQRLAQQDADTQEQIRVRRVAAQLRSNSARTIQVSERDILSAFFICCMAAWLCDLLTCCLIVSHLGSLCLPHLTALVQAVQGEPHLRGLPGGRSFYHPPQTARGLLAAAAPPPLQWGPALVVTEPQPSPRGDGYAWLPGLQHCWLSCRDPSAPALPAKATV